MKTILEEEKILATIRSIGSDTFTVLDFIQAFKELYRADWRMLKERFGEFGEKRRYTVTTYFSNRLDLYSQKPQSLLKPFARYSENRWRDYRKATEGELKHFGGRWIAVFRKKPETK